MSVTVKNVGAIARGPQNQMNASGSDDWQGDQGTVRVVLRGVEYVWGPNDSKTLPNDIGAEAVAADGRLKLADSQEGFNGTARS